MSLRPLSVKELQMALAIEPFDQTVEGMRLLLSPSGDPLVRIRNDGTVVLVHQFLKEYLLSSQAPVLKISRNVLGMVDSNRWFRLRWHSAFMSWYAQAPAD
jgi:hypothetical protein